MSVADMLVTPPDVTHGVGLGFGGWRLSVEALLPDDPEGYWQLGEWGSTPWTARTWVDITSHVRGVEWTRGADEPKGRPRVGELVMTVDNRGRSWSPYVTSSPFGSPAEWGPGMIIRVGARSESAPFVDGWLPQFTGIVDSWNEQHEPGGGDRWIEVRAYETLRDLAQIDDNALSGVVGLDDWAAERVSRLLDAASWRYGLDTDVWHHTYPPDIGSNFWALQSTDMAANRLTECYVTADSSDAVFRSSRRGTALIASHPLWAAASDPMVPWYAAMSRQHWPLVDWSWDDPTGSTGATMKVPVVNFDWYEHRESSAFGDSLYVPYNVEDLAVVNEDAYIVNDARMARVGGVQQVREQPFSISRFGRRTMVRSDLLNRFDGPVDWLAYHAATRSGLNTLRIDNLTVATSDRGPDVYTAMMAADVGARAYAYFPDETLGLNDRARLVGWVRSTTHRVTPRHRSGRVSWSTSVALDTELVEGFPAAQLPATPI